MVPGGRIWFTGGALFRIDPVNISRDEAVYECTAENKVGDVVTAKATLQVYNAEELPSGFPKIAPPPSSKVVEVNHTAVLHCAATGNPTPEISWVRNMFPIDVAANPRYSITDKPMPGTLHIIDSVEDDHGTYECIAENSLGTEYSRPTTLHVKERRVAPKFTIKPPPVHEVMLGDNLNLTCVAAGSPMPRVKWRKGVATDLTPEDQIPIGRNILKLTNIQESENYTCIASSVMALIETTTLVKVQSLPSAPTNLQVSDVTATSAQLSWSYTGPEEIQYYVIQCKPKHANQDFSEISGVITSYYAVRSLSPYTEYEMSVIAVNNIGRGPPSQSVVVTTGETADLAIGNTKPGTAPRNVQVRPLSSSTMVIQWDEPETANGQVTGYKVYYTTNPQLPIASWESQMVDVNHLTTISGLTPLTTYTIRVQAFTSVGPGPLSTPALVKTQQGVPSQPINLRVTDFDETSATLQWGRPVHSSENIVSYELYWNDTYANEKHHTAIPAAESYTLNELYPNTLYYVWLAARNQRGEGATTPPIPFRTKQYGKGENFHLRIRTSPDKPVEMPGMLGDVSQLEKRRKTVKKHSTICWEGVCLYGAPWGKPHLPVARS
ncbi:hypothetical protein RUM44_002875 [Polyplax serrata]|uniref:Tyrosine-protein phosphatase Lar n=1 Tax=Polyplax serrata TaxID=468196 RepID=A0ABR1AWY1_POLSC